MPSQQLLAPFPSLQNLFGSLSACIKKGDLDAFSKVLQENEEIYIELRIYLTVERGRDICMRNLFRKVFVAGGFEESTEAGKAPLRKTRVPLTYFTAGLWAMGQDDIDLDEAECLVANMIYKVRHNRRSLLIYSFSSLFSPF